jgi:hypothetical protein
MVKAFPTISAEEFAEACCKLEENVSGRLDGTNWLGLTWDEEGALHIKKQSEVEPQRNGNYDQETNEDNEPVEPDDKVGFPSSPISMLSDITQVHIAQTGPSIDSHHRLLDYHITNVSSSSPMVHFP